MNQPSIKNFKDPTDLAQWIKGLLYVGMGLAVVAVVFGILDYRILTMRHELALTFDDEISKSEMRQTTIAILRSTIGVWTGFLVLKWIYRINNNVHQL